MIKIAISFFLMAMSMTSYAGLWGITHHSRANCFNNESISWWAGHNRWYSVISEHCDAITGEYYHDVETGWQNTWRAAAVHYAEGDGRDMIYYKVHGTHWMPNGRGGVDLVAEEWVEDCSIYDGWWD